MIELLQRQTPTLIPLDFRPANSPNLSSVDCRIWGMLQARVYQTLVQDMTDLRQPLSTHGIAYHRALWVMLLTKCVTEKGGHFEHLLY